MLCRCNASFSICELFFSQTISRNAAEKKNFMNRGFLSSAILLFFFMGRFVFR